MHITVYSCISTMYVANHSVEYSYRASALLHDPLAAAIYRSIPISRSIYHGRIVKFIFKNGRLRQTKLVYSQRFIPVWPTALFNILISLPYSLNISREKIFADFDVFQLTSKILSLIMLG